MLNPKYISLKDSHYMTGIRLHHDCHVNCEVKANQGYGHAAKFVSFLGIGNEICKTHDRVHNQGDHRLVKQLHSSLFYWLVDIEIANDHDRCLDSE
jgi:hypothetical protein